MSKEYVLTSEEQEHIAHINYTMQYLDKTLGLFLQSVIAGRLGITGNIQYKLDDDKIVIDET